MLLIGFPDRFNSCPSMVVGVTEVSPTACLPPAVCEERGHFHLPTVESVSSGASLTTSRQATSLVIGGKKIPSSPLKDDGVSAFLALID